MYVEKIPRNFPKKYMEKLIEWVSSLYVRGSISIIGLIGGMDRSIKKPDRSSNLTGGPAENSEKDYLDDLELHLAKRLGLSVNEEGNGTVPRMCPNCGYSSPFQSHTRGIGVRMWLI